MKDNSKTTKKRARERTHTEIMTTTARTATTTTTTRNIFDSNRTDNQATEVSSFGLVAKSKVQ